MKLNWFDHEWSPWKLENGEYSMCAGFTRIKMLNRVSANNEASLTRVRLEAGAPVEEAPYIHERPTVFVPCDWLNPDVPEAIRVHFLKLIHATPHLQWLLLSQQPERWWMHMQLVLVEITDGTGKDGGFWQWVVNWIGGKPPANVHVGTSVEDQPQADERIPHLIHIPAVGRFLLMDPKGSLDLRMMRSDGELGQGEPWLDCLNGNVSDSYGDGTNVDRIDRVIIGSANAGNPEWIRQLVDQCAEVGTPVFVNGGWV